MSVITNGRLIGTPAESRDYMPLILWLILISCIGLGLLVLFRLGLIQIMLETDRSHISMLILAIFALTTLHCLYQVVVISRELVAARRIRQTILDGASGFLLIGDQVKTAEGEVLEPGIAARHIANLVAKSRAQNGRRVDQTLLLRSLADQLRGREKLGFFVAEALLRLALLGTAVGFILMLVPIAGLSSFDVETLRTALAGMSGGMAVALNVTVAGITCALLLKMEYYILDAANAQLFNIITEVTEVHVVSALEKN
ncbi:MotA/TolQ/ExbB proton channel family protein [Chelativorans sp. J32]|uniref:MotA/TolQ/ExbB proton channel family protein n=1 Tax=Chelativorans sp. J32 TaxID=935840 RepID=UPI000481A5CC|nr:MotA/TolQ/ExbB proton channel family protein [Chelativorans sp. J32]